MARFSAAGLDELELSMSEISEIPRNIKIEMLMAGGQVAIEAQKKQIASLGLVDTGKLRDSIRAFPKVNRNGDWYVLVYPYGKHHTYRRKQVTKSCARSKHGRTYTIGGDAKDVTNNDLGFVYEFGAPNRHIPALQWMRTANEQCSAQTTQAMMDVYSKWLESKKI
jgi:hypothetical protein